MREYIVTVRFTVDANAEEHIQTARAIEDEVRSWLASLDADVQVVTVDEVKS